MGVPCPRCGRGYDVALFAFGRTLHCACGARVGFGERLRAASPPRFAADAMLGRLARWLRNLGFDTSFEAHVPDEALVRRAFAEGRTVLTRDRRLPEEWTLVPVCVIESQDLAGQLAELGSRFALGEHARPFSRCNRCNEPLEPASAAEARHAGLRRRLPVASGAAGAGGRRRERSPGPPARGLPLGRPGVRSVDPASRGDAVRDHRHRGDPAPLGCPPVDLPAVVRPRLRAAGADRRRRSAVRAAIHA